MPFERRSAREYVRQILLERILNGTYKPGERLVEPQIAGELDTSLSPIREALRDLEGLGLVESERYKGTRVRAVTEQEIEEAYQIRAVLEGLASELATPKLQGNTQRLKEHLDGLIQAAQDKDAERFTQHDMAFHREIVEASGNKMLLGMWEQVVIEHRFRITLVRIGEENLPAFGEAHAPIYEAIAGGDAKLAGQLSRDLVCQFHSRRPAPGG